MYKTNNNIINNNNLIYYIKIFDFISISQKSNSIYHNMYNGLRKLFFEFQQNKSSIYIRQIYL